MPDDVSRSLGDLFATHLLYIIFQIRSDSRNVNKNLQMVDIDKYFRLCHNYRSECKIK